MPQTTTNTLTRLCVLLLTSASWQVLAQAPHEGATASAVHAGAQPGGSGPTIVLRPAIPAYFPGCDHLPEGGDGKLACATEKLMGYIARELVYPGAASEAGIQGVAILTFVVTDRGEIRDITVLRDIGGGCGDEAARVIAQMPRWQPAIHHGATVYTQFMLPITFGLRANEFDYALQLGDLDGEEVTRQELLDLVTTGAYTVTDPKGAKLTITEVVYTLERGDERTQLVTRGAERPDAKAFGRFLGRRPARLTIEANAVDGLDIRTVTRQFAVVR